MLDKIIGEKIVSIDFNNKGSAIYIELENGKSFEIHHMSKGSAIERNLIYTENKTISIDSADHLENIGSAKLVEDITTGILGKVISYGDGYFVTIKDSEGNEETIDAHFLKVKEK